MHVIYHESRWSHHQAARSNQYEQGANTSSATVWKDASFVDGMKELVNFAGALTLAYGGRFVSWSNENNCLWPYFVEVPDVKDAVNLRSMRSARQTLSEQRWVDEFACLKKLSVNVNSGKILGIRSLNRSALCSLKNDVVEPMNEVAYYFIGKPT